MLCCQAHAACLIFPRSGRTAAALLSSLLRPALRYLINYCVQNKEILEQHNHQWEGWRETCCRVRCSSVVRTPDTKLHNHCLSGQGPIPIFN